MSGFCKNVFEAILRYGHDEDFDPRPTTISSQPMLLLVRQRRSMY